MTRYLSHLMVFLLVAAAYLAGALEPVERALMDLRFNLLQRDAGGDLVVVDIDARSLRALDTWPWPRRYHAQLLDRLRQAGARDIAFDINFAAKSTPKDDAALAAALERAAGQVVLPVFKQFMVDADGAPGMVHSEPLAVFAHHARRALVNVQVESDGHIRRYEKRGIWKRLEIDGMAAVLAGPSSGEAHEFYIDFGIRAESLPRLSYVDVLQGRFDAAAIAGKIVVVGASAADLGDTFTVPVYGALPGVILQAIAYESLVQGRALDRSAPAAIVLLALLLALALGPRFAGWSWRTGLAVTAGAGAGAVLVSVAVQAAAPVSMDTAPLILVPLLSYAVGLWRVIDTQAWSIFRHRLDALHRRAMMQCVVEDSFDGIAIVNQDGVIEVLNPAAESILGKPEADLVGTPIHSHIPWTSEIEQLYGDAETDDDDQPARKAVGPTEFTLICKDGVERVIELMVSASRLLIATGALERRSDTRTVQIYTFRDVTERKRAEDAQKTALAEATVASRAKTEFLANMSHELRTPLNAVIGFAELIKAQPFGPVGAPQYVEYIDDIFNSGQHLLAVINDILDMSKIEAGEMELTEAVFDIHEVTASCLRLISERAHKGGLEVAVELPDDLPWIRADQRMVKQMLLNLLTNAVKFTPEGGRITLRAEIDAVGCYVISVIDTGIGIAPKDMERIFQPFGQADTTLQRQYEGTGLGLPLVKAMAELHGALLVIDSTPNAGTTAAIRFPVARVTTRVSRHAENRAA
jgi:PAS domain S-box-containing protein